MTHTKGFYPETWIKEYEKRTGINFYKVSEEYAKQIATQVDKLTIQKLSLITLKKLKKLVDKEIEWRENLLKWYHIEDVDLVRKVEE